VTRLLPDWIQAYMAYTAESRSPDEFHLWTALVTIAGALRRKVFFNFEYFLLYPNLYVVLVSPAGRCKKSTAMRIGRKFLSQVPGVNFVTDSISRERLIQDLTQSYADGHSSMTAYSSEFASLLTTSGMDMVVFLTDVYDCPTEWTHRTKTGGTGKIRQPYLNLEGGTTPDWIARSLPLDTVGIGLTSRIIFVYSETPRVREAFPKMSDAQRQLEELLVKDLVQISTMVGEYRMEEGAVALYKEWDLKMQQDRPLYDPRLSGYYERKGMHLIKVSMIVAASQRDETIITKTDLEKAMSYLGALEPSMERAFAAVGKNPLSLDIQNIGDVIRQVPGIGYGKLVEMFKHSLRKDEMEEVIALLNAMGQIKIAQQGDGPHYYPSQRDRQS
jgi:hypothetical protein